MKRAVISFFMVMMIAVVPTGCALTKKVQSNPKNFESKTIEVLEGETNLAEIPENSATFSGEITEEIPLGEDTLILSEGFTSIPVPKTIREKMVGKSYPENCPVPFEDLRYLQMLHIGFDGQTHKGEMIVNKKIAKAVLEIFSQLFEAKYPIEKIRLIDEYDAIDEASMTDNNTSSFCYRTISGSSKLSYHARGLAVDVNTLYNPYVSKTKLEPAAAKEHAYNRDKANNPYYINEDDLCYKLFTEHGFFWGGNWNAVKDYQHFEMQD